MKSIFDAPPFGSRGLHGHAPGMVRLAQATTTPAPATSPDDSDVTGLTSGIESLLKQLPPDVLGSFNTKYQECQAQLSTGGAVGLAAGGKCLYALYNELKDFIQNGPRPKPAPVQPPPAAPFPVLPVAVGGLGLIVLIWGLSKL